MIFERLTDRARMVMAYANQEAQRLNHEYIGTEHILLGLLKYESNVACIALQSLDAEIGAIRATTLQLANAGSEVVTLGKVPQTPRAKKVIEYAIAEARLLGHGYVGTEHFLLGLLREEDGVAAHVLIQHGMTYDAVRTAVQQVLKAHADDPAFANRLGHQPPPMPFIARLLERIVGPGTKPPRSDPTSAAVLLVLLDTPNCLAWRALQRVNVDLAALRAELHKLIDAGEVDPA